MSCPRFARSVSQRTAGIRFLTMTKSRIYKKLKLVKRGVLTSENSIIVDNVNLPRKVYGISDGYGSFKKISEKKIIKIKKVIKFNK